MPVRVLVTEGARADCTKAGELIEGIDAQCLLADRGYDTNEIVENAFMHLKCWCGIATRYAKNLASFVAAVQIRCIALWAETL
jgi:hypothetical protein